MPRSLFIPLLLVLFTLPACRTPQPETAETSPLPVARALGGEADPGYARALEPRPFHFPADHGPHPDFRTEWWYFTGNLEGADGRRFGYQLTLFRVALAPREVERASAWGTRQMLMAHFALTDPAAGRFHHHERFSRAALGLAGADAAPFRVWLEDWSLAAAGDDFLPLRLRAAAGAIAIDLRLESLKPIVLQGDRGLSRKSAEPGNASYYYSLTRLPTAGTVQVNGERFPVHGLSWLDREWSTSALGAEQAGWDWFALQLADGRELMFYRLRRHDGGDSPWSAGTLVEADGTARPLAPAEVDLRELEQWRSPASGARYPSRWRLAVPAAGVDLEIEPLLADQELRLTVRYWEGAVRVRGRSGGKPVSGYGYVELTGY